MFLVSFKIFFKRKNLFLFFEKLNRTKYGLKFFPKIMTVFPSKNKQRLFWINICFRQVKLTSVSAALWKLDTCIVFLPIFMLFPVLLFVFCPKLLFFAIFDNAEAFVVLATNINHQSTVCLQTNKNSPFTCNKIQDNKTPFACNKHQAAIHCFCLSKYQKTISCFAWN